MISRILEEDKCRLILIEKTASLYEFYIHTYYIYSEFNYIYICIHISIGKDLKWHIYIASCMYSYVQINISMLLGTLCRIYNDIFVYNVLDTYTYIIFKALILAIQIPNTFHLLTN